MKNKLILLLLLVLTTACSKKVYQTNPKTNTNSDEGNSLNTVIKSFNTAISVNKQMTRIKADWFAMIEPKWEYYNQEGRTQLLRSDSAKLDFVPYVTFKIAKNDIRNYQEGSNPKPLLQLDSSKCDIYLFKERKFVGAYFTMLENGKWQNLGGSGNISNQIADEMNSYIGKGEFFAIQFYKDTKAVVRTLAINVNDQIYVFDDYGGISPLSTRLITLKKAMILGESRHGNGRDY